jgi:signal transduction histidine kinase
MISIRKRLALQFIFIIFFTVIVLEVLIIHTVKQNYYKNLEDSLFNQLRVSCELYSRYFSDSVLYDNVLNNVDSFWKQASVQVEIIDTDGKVLMDSIGVIPSDTWELKDVSAALKGEKGAWIGKVHYDREQVMAVSYPLKSKGRIVGALRFISSLREVNRDVALISYLFIGIGLIVVFMSVLLSLFMANSIVNPLKEITRVAEKMAAGNFNIKCSRRYDEEIGKLADTMNYMAQEIIKKDQLKNDFISSVSHELRTPLTSIKGWAVTLKEGNAEDRELLADGLEIIEKESDRLTAMVEELLDFSRFVSGKATVKREQVYIPETMNHIKKQLEPRAARENISLEVFYGPEVCDVVSDENRLKQIFINILDNSFRFTQPGGSIEFRAEQRNGSICFQIRDTGCGIPPDELPKVREKFYKGRNSKSRNGIGLSICDEIIRLMNGTFEIRSEVGKGTETWITLPTGER